MNNKKSTIILTIMLFFATFSLLSCGKKSAGKAEAAAVDTTQVLATRISQCSRLYTSEYQLRKVLIYDDPASVSGSLFHHDFKLDLPLGKRRIAIPVTATAKAYVDLSKVQPRNIHRSGDKIEIVLPDPQVQLTSTLIDHKNVRQKVGVLRSHFTDEEITSIQQQGRKDIVKSLSSTDIIENARLSAARQLIPLAEQMGYEEGNITVTFRKDLTSADIPALIRQID